MKYCITILISLLVAQCCTAEIFNVHIHITNAFIDSAIVNVSGSKQLVNLREDSLAIKFKNKSTTALVKVSVDGYYPYFLKVNNKNNFYSITLLPAQSANNIYNRTTRNNKTIHLGSSPNISKSGNLNVGVLNGQTLVIPVYIAESNPLFIENLKMQINAYASPLPEMKVEISIIEFNPNFKNNDLIDIYKDSINRVLLDTFNLTGKGNYSFALNKEVKGCFLLLIKNCYNQELAKTYKSPIYFGLKRRKIFKNNALNHIIIGYVKYVNDNEIPADVALPTQYKYNNPIAIELNFK